MVATTQVNSGTSARRLTKKGDCYASLCSNVSGRRVSVLARATLLGAVAARSIGSLGRIGSRAQHRSVDWHRLAKNSKGQLTGTFAQLADGIKALPLTSVTVEGRAVRLLLKSGTGGGAFEGTVSADGKSMSGDFTAAEGYTLPFTFTRTGDAQIMAVPKGGPIAKELEGRWNGALDVDGKQLRLVVKMSNLPDATSAGTVLSVDGSGVEVPIAITQKGSTVMIDVPSVGASFAVVLNAAATELAGTWTQGASTLPLTLKRATQ